MKNVVMALALLFSINAKAGLIDININADEVSVGDTVTVDVIGSAFSDFDFFNFDILFDTSVFSFDADLLTTNLPLAEDFGFGLQALEVPLIGANFAFFDLFPFTNGAFNISFDLTAISAGATDFIFSTELVDQGFSIADPFDPLALPTPLEVNVTQSDTVVTASEVPEPGSILLLAMAMMILVNVRKLVK